MTVFVKFVARAAAAVILVVAVGGAPFLFDGSITTSATPQADGSSVPSSRASSSGAPTRTSTPTATSTVTPTATPTPSASANVAPPVAAAPVAPQPASVPSGTSVTAGSVVWQGFQRPSVAGVVQQGSIQNAGPAGNSMAGVHRFQLDPGATYTSSGYVAHRVEIFGRQPAPMTADPALWPDPVGSVRWYTMSLYLPAGFPTATDTRWFLFTQWKGMNGGSPPLAMEIKRDGLRLGGARTNAGLIPNGGALGPIAVGSWTTFSIGMLLSPDPAVGWVEVVRDGRVAIPRTAVATMDIVNGAVDPIYLKQGIYRDPAWDVSQTLYLGPVIVSSSPPAGVAG